jgi:hypothetical protein
MVGREDESSSDEVLADRSIPTVRIEDGPSSDEPPPKTHSANPQKRPRRHRREDAPLELVGVRAGWVQAQWVQAGRVQAGRVQAGWVQAGWVQAGRVQAGRVMGGRVMEEPSAGRVRRGRVE